MSPTSRGSWCACSRGTSDDALLDTYTIERREHVKRLTTVIKDIGRVICERDPVAARARDERMLAEAGGHVKTQPRQELIPPLAEGLLSPVAHRANGTIFPQPRVERGTARPCFSTMWPEPDFASSPTGRAAR